MLISLYTSRVVLSVLGVEDYGIYNVVGGIAGSFNFLSSMLSNATQRYLNMAIGQNDRRRSNQVFNMNLLIFFSYAIISILFVEIGGHWFIENKMSIEAERVDAAYFCLHATAIVLFISLLSTVYESVLIARENMKVYAYIGIYDAVVKLAIVYILSFLSFDKLIVYSILMAIMSITVKLIPTIYTIKYYEETKIKFYWEQTSFRSMLNFISWNFISTIVFIMNDQGMNMLLNIFFGPAVNAARGLSVQVKNAVCNFAMGFFTAVRPQIVKSYAAGDVSRFLDLIFNSGKFTFYLLWLLCLPVMLHAENILHFWLGNVPEWTSEFIIWILIFNLINSSFCDPMWQGMQAIGILKKYVCVGSIIYILAFPLTWIAFKLDCSPLLAFQILVVIRVIYFIITTYIFRQYVPFSCRMYLNNVFIPITKVVVTSFIASTFISQFMSSHFIVTILSCIINVVFVLLSIYFVGLTRKEKDLVLVTIKNKLIRKSK